MRGDQGDRSDVPNYCVVITDGGSNMEKDKTVPMAIEARTKVCTPFTFNKTVMVEVINVLVENIHREGNFRAVVAR